MSLSIVLAAVLGAGIAWGATALLGLHRYELESQAVNLRLEIGKTHPEMMVEMMPFIDCAVARQKNFGKDFEYLLDRLALATRLRADVLLCANEADTAEAVALRLAPSKARSIKASTTAPEAHTPWRESLPVRNTQQPRQNGSSTAGPWIQLMPGLETAQAGPPVSETSTQSTPFLSVNNPSSLIVPVPAQSPLEIVRPPIDQ